jgi:AcrR family transcriptional regulator
VQPLSRERVVDVALELVDERGVEALSMRAIAARLGCEAMSLYRHVPNKAALLDAVGQRVVAELDVPDPGRGEWQEVICELMRELRRVALRHPGAFSLLNRQPIAVLGAPPLDTGMVALERAGLGEQEAASALCALVAFATGAIDHELASAEREQYPGPGADAEQWDWGAGRARRFLELMAATSYEAEFDAGLQMLLAGLRPPPD